MDIVEKKQILADYFKKSGVLNKANDLLGNYEKKCREVVISLPEDIQKDILKGDKNYVFGPKGIIDEN